MSRAALRVAMVASLTGFVVLAGSRAAAQSEVPPKRIHLSIDITAALAGAQEPGHGTGHGGIGGEEARELVSEWRQSIDENNDTEADGIIPKLREVLALEGSRDREVVLGAFLALGRDWTLAENWSGARRAYDAALALDPDNASALAGKAAMAWKQQSGPQRILAALAGVVQAARSGVSTALGALRAIANSGLVLVVALMATIAGFSLVMLAKYNRLLRHGARELLAERVPEGVDRALAWAVVFLPVLLFLSPTWWVLYWLVVMSGYGTAAEKRLTWLAIFLLALVPIGFHLVSVLSSLQRDPILRAVSQLSRGGVTADLIDDVQGSRETKAMPASQLLVARLYTATRRNEDAIQAYTDLLAQHPNEARALVNRANIQLRRGDTATALADYKHAVDADSHDALALRNGSVAYAQNLDSKMQEDWMARAQKLDRDSVRRWNAAGADVVVDAGITTGELRDLVHAEHADFVGDLVRSILNPLTLAALLALVFMVWRVRREGGILEALACQKCGRAFCARCHAAARSSAYCTQCTHLYVKKDGVSPVVRAAKLREVERWGAVNSLAVRFFNLALPGAGSLYANRTGSGVVLLFAWSASVAMLAAPTRARMLFDPARIGSFDLTALFVVQVALLLVVYVVAIVQSLRHSD